MGAQPTTGKPTDKRRTPEFRAAARERALRQWRGPHRYRPKSAGAKSQRKGSCCHSR
jgi:hypothetical protein